jgi:hypothetical protein
MFPFYPQPLCDDGGGFLVLRLPCKVEEDKQLLGLGLLLLYL